MTRFVGTQMLLAFAGAAAVGLLTGSVSSHARERTGARRLRRSNRQACHVVVVGAGFGGLAAATRLAGRPGVDLTVIDAQNHHLFQPLLYQVATAALSPDDIASPVRGILPASPYLHILMARVTGVDTQAQRVLCDGQAIPYDQLIIATGSRPSYFGHADWAGLAPSLKTLDDALGLRRQILDVFERAAHADAGDRERLLTFVLIGGGPTGVEMAGSIAELARDVLKRDFDLPDTSARIVLVEAGPRILPTFPPDLSSYAAAALRQLGVEIITGTKVTAIAPGEVHLGERPIAAASVIWTAGTEATPVAEWLGVKPAHGGRVAVGPDLRVQGHADIAVIGDAALAVGKDGKPLPGLAPVAKQQGQFVAHAILRRLRGRPAPGAFTYRDYGSLATIGRNKAVAEFGALHMTGFLAWATWAVAHIFFLIGFRNRVMVSTQWAFAYLAHERGDRLILGRKARP
jgi:NADH dehydrogenase